MNLLNFVLVGSILVVESCSANPTHVEIPNDRIVGGYETTIEENPWQVSVRYLSSHNCGGSIIGANWILTAAHCTAVDVRVGSTSHRSGGKIIALKRIVRHPKHDAAISDFDFSLLELAEPLTFNDQIQPIALPKANAKIRDGTKCLVSGWGYTQSPNESDELLRAVIVPIVNQAYCNKQYQGKITPRMICAGYEEGGKDSCYGDSGGPLIDVNNENIPIVVGVVSFGRGCAEPNYPGVYARVTSAREWIESVTGI